MSILTFEKMTIPSADFGGESTLPLLSLKLRNKKKIKYQFGESDGLYVNYGRVNCAFPYKAQDMYNRELKDTEYDIAVLENENLKATFIPALGGKLHSLFDKKKNRELLFSNSVIRPCNLAVRNAWTSGGVEWNMGFTGHHAYTCSLINTAKTTLEDGTPVLRFYYFERIRECIAQLDMFLPDGSEVLYVRGRITNPNDEVTPMYWWSNIATVQEEGARVIVPAEETFLIVGDTYTKTDIPVFNGTDVTYPLNSKTAYDYFWKTKDNSLKYICQLDKDGYGLANSSTDTLKGRKLFVWGDSQGGRRWQNFLTEDDKTGSYNEIQVGLARTQLECVPMPPRTVWEWVETYGAMQADKDKVHGQWSGAKAEVEAIFAKNITKDYLNKVLDDTRKMAKSKAEMVFANEGWASLELIRREKSSESGIMCDHLEFAKVGKAQECWISLLNDGTVGAHSADEAPVSYQIKQEWLDMLKEAVLNKDKDNWYAYYLLGTALVAKGELETAKKYLKKSIALENSAWANYAMAMIFRFENDGENYVEYMQKAFEIKNDDISLAKDVFRCLHENEKSDEVIKMYEALPDNIKAIPRCKLCYAYALARKGMIDKAETVILQNGRYIDIADIREAETSITSLWMLINEKRGKSDEPPYAIDFRMSYNQKNDK